MSESADKQVVFDEIRWVNEYFHTRQSESIKVEDIEKVLRFTLMWNLFEAKICEKRYSNAKIENAINLIEKRDLLDLGEFKNSINYFRERYSDKTTLEALNFWTGQDKTRKQIVEDFVSRSNPQKADITAIIYIIYRLRNNMFHGEKPLMKLKYQDQNFAFANEFLAQFLDLHKKLKMPEPQ